MNGNGETPRGGRPLPRSWGWFGLWLSLSLAVLAAMMLLAGCGSPCAGHGGVTDVIPHVSGVYDYRCADGTWTAA